MRFNSIHFGCLYQTVMGGPGGTVAVNSYSKVSNCIFCQNDTKSELQTVVMDAGIAIEENVEWLNRKGFHSEVSWHH